MGALMEDERVMRKHDDINKYLSYCINYVHSLPWTVWTIMSYVVGSSIQQRDVKTDCLLGCHIAASFVIRRIFMVAGSRPWPVTIGDDVAAHIRNLQVDCDDGPVTIKIAQLRDMGRSLSF